MRRNLLLFNVFLITFTTCVIGCNRDGRLTSDDLLIACYELDELRVERAINAGIGVNAHCDQISASRFRDPWTFGTPSDVASWTPLIALLNSNITNVPEEDFENTTSGLERAAEVRSIMLADKESVSKRNLSRVRIAKRLLDSGANLEDADGCGRTPMCIAAERGLIDICRLLLERKANVNAVAKGCHDGPGGATVLHYAVRFPVIVRECLAAGADACVADLAGLTPLEWARYLRIDESVVLFEGTSEKSGRR